MYSCFVFDSIKKCIVQYLDIKKEYSESEVFFFFCCIIVSKNLHDTKLWFVIEILLRKCTTDFHKYHSDFKHYNYKMALIDCFLRKEI